MAARFSLQMAVRFKYRYGIEGFAFLEAVDSWQQQSQFHSMPREGTEKNNEECSQD
jgi:hypothetical protein